MCSAIEVINFFYLFSFLEAALTNWSLISLVDLIAFLLIQYAAPKIGKQWICWSNFALSLQFCSSNIP